MKIVEIGNESVTFDNGYVLMSNHEQDCCEWHWLDFLMLKDCNVSIITGEDIDIYQQEFDFTDGVNFKRIPNEGILLYDVTGNKYFIAGRASNNGYYGDNIDLQLYDEEGNLLYEYNVTECQEEW